MSAQSTPLQGFAYGEHVEGAPGRSFGYRLLAPVAPENWGDEVEALARRLQAAPYPEPWPPVELFCSTLLMDGRRLVAVARYGLADHTPSHRRGGLELIGVLGPGSLGVPSALAVYRWLKKRRADTEDLHCLGGHHALADVLSAVPPRPPPDDPVPVLPIRLWQEGALLFAATAPTDPDHRLGLLEQGVTATWQWIPLVGADFPLQSYAQWGPVVAWTPHLAGVAVKLERKPAEGPVRLSGRPGLLVAGVLSGLVLLFGANLWAMLSLFHRLGTAGPLERHAASSADADKPGPPGIDKTSGEKFILALLRLLHRQAGTPTGDPVRINERYERLLAGDRDLGLAGQEGKELVLALSTLSRRSSQRIEALIHQALDGKGYDPKLVDLACRQVREQLAVEEQAKP
ncbi:MAG TPA: hypothetical protein VG013_29045 [Gemmataceae bacterium]|jgi:hypothetical protein|nr:hypothetical protein [Gemmataceae bacterium]